MIKASMKDGELKASQILKDIKTKKKNTILFDSKIRVIQVNKKANRSLLFGFNIITDNNIILSFN